MALPDELNDFLREMGWREPANPAEFWRSERTSISRMLNTRHPTLVQKWENQIRWETDMGKACQQAVRKFIEEHNTRVQKEVGEASLACLDSESPRDWHVDSMLSFDRFTFEFGDARYTLNDFQRSFPGPRIYPQANLMGVDLTSLHLELCVLSDACLVDARLDLAYFQNVTLAGTTLNGATLRGARIQSISFQRGHITRCDVSGAFVNAISFSDSAVGEGLVFTRVRYWYLVSELFHSWASCVSQRNRSRESKSNHTDFVFNDTRDLTRSESREFKEYVNWYQYVTRQLSVFKHLPLVEKLMFSGSLIFTKAWSSYSVLVAWGMITNLVFATCYHANHDHFKNLDSTFLSALYFSFVTFATLGYGDITPSPGVPQILVMCEVLLGYLMLGCLVFLIGQKVSWRY